MWGCVKLVVVVLLILGALFIVVPLALVMMGEKADPDFMWQSQMIGFALCVPAGLFAWAERKRMLKSGPPRGAVGKAAYKASASVLRAFGSTFAFATAGFVLTFFTVVASEGFRPPLLLLWLLAVLTSGGATACFRKASELIAATEASSTSEALAGLKDR